MGCFFPGRGEGSVQCNASWVMNTHHPPQNEQTNMTENIDLNTLSKVQKILRNATRSENTFQSFNIEVYEKIFSQLRF